MYGSPIADLRKIRAVDPAGIVLPLSIAMVMRTLPSTVSTPVTLP